MTRPPGGSARPRGPFPCPVCGEEVPAGAVCCRACGADDETGWGGDAAMDEAGETSLDDREYDDFVRTELEDDAIETEGPSGFGLLLVVLGVVAVAALLGLLLSAGK